ncbi:nitrogen fixation/metabolism regulation signal transduction histidine kinase [Sphingopyxis panaciterrae]|uniref:sensor histidine kinase n=1 Tax=Sphingopyxis panaciterrae TaxID=363841 RepID=UPI0014235019|nr:ATP-binding protein [Sphingopyxis panaciterrae]NIJ35447.1 nitrogen fixation/metabolism regulation signal transduction histidine kinase [Sphingopyxis panaciterrae]
MGFSLPRHWPFAAGLAGLGLLAGCLAAGGGAFALSGRPALAVIAWTLALLVMVALVRAARRAERATCELVDQLASGAADSPAPLPSAFADLDASIARALAAMQAREARYGASTDADAALLDTVPAALFVTDADGRIVRSNRAARALSTTIPADFAHHPAFASSDSAALLASGPDAGHMLRLTDGRAAHASVALFDLANGAQRRLIAVQSVSAELGAVETDAWHRLSRVLAHEMMNSLSPVISLAESLVALAQNPAADPDRRETAAAAATIARRAQHLMGFVERYRQWLTIPEPQFAPVDLREFAGDLVTVTRKFSSSVEVRLVADTSDAIVTMDRELIGQALLNLLKNGVEAAQGTPGPLVILRYGIDAGIMAFVVEDNGPGLPGNAEDPFLPFYTTKAGGSGIGLAVARQIAIAHGGSLLARTIDRGARFSMCLPLRPDQ